MVPAAGGGAGLVWLRAGIRTRAELRAGGTSKNYKLDRPPALPLAAAPRYRAGYPRYISD